MKKIISTLVAFCLVLSMSITAFAAQVTPADVQNEIDSTVNYLNANGYTIDTALSYYYLVERSDEASDCYDNFAQSVLDSLDANNGHIVGSYGENFATTSACVAIIGQFENPNDFNGYDLVELLNNADTSTVTNPYYYDIAIPTAARYCDEDVTRALCDDFINNYYDMGSGMDYYGNGCDNDAMFLSAISQSGLDDLKDYADDAYALLDNYAVDGGYCYNPMYGTDANADSTALALRGMCYYYTAFATGDESVLDKINDTYEDLISFKGTAEGSYTAYGSDDAYATNDALKGLNAYNMLLTLMMDENDEEETTTQPTTQPSTNTTAKPNTSAKSPNTGLTIPALTISLAGASIITLLSKKHND